MNKKIKITEVVLRDAHQSLLATRLRYEDMESTLKLIDDVGYWSVESWGGAIFDSCIRYLGEDPWERIRNIKSHMPNTPQQMLLRGQNLLGYKHYADDLVYKFVETAKKNGVDVFRVFDAMNDERNIKKALEAVIELMVMLKAQSHTLQALFIITMYGFQWHKNFKIMAPILSLLKIWQVYYLHTLDLN